ncbi:MULTISPECIES: transcriptional activator RinB [Staphylococcus]|uniref:transcriptional activator RinB n=1 Tax=Staphylococcus TaxID=1279 RepID=UPI001F4637FA|nr:MULTISPECIES: transcriptional activator RinB [Staphylococcus]MCE4963051.1 transcriptional regulator [Staphylococcus haemolyticus]WKU13020.1 transcriptional activator RinB [Staphylococcus devriesei]
MIKRILKIWFTIAMYELGKYITNQIIIKLQSEDEVDQAPQDFNKYDHIHLNAEVSYRC